MWPPLNTLRPRQNGRRFTDITFKCIFLNEIVRILIEISLKFVPKGPINNIPALVQIMAWRRSGDKPLSEPMMVSLLTHMWVTWPQWVNKGQYCIFIQIQWKFHSAFIQVLVKWSLWNFTYCATTVLLWHVQNLLMLKCNDTHCVVTYT